MSGAARIASVDAVTRPHPIVWLRVNPRSADMILAACITAAAVTVHLLELDQTEDFREPSWWTVPFIVASVFPIAQSALSARLSAGFCPHAARRIHKLICVKPPDTAATQNCKCRNGSTALTRQTFINQPKEKAMFSSIITGRFAAAAVLMQTLRISSRARSMKGSRQRPYGQQVWRERPTTGSSEQKCGW